MGHDIITLCNKDFKNSSGEKLCSGLEIPEDVKVSRGEISEGEDILLSVVSPAYNEELNLEHFCESVSKTLDDLGISWEIILIDDGSTDHSAEIMRSLHEKDPRVKSVILGRNFGNQLAIAAGFRASSGRAVVVMDADLQQPPETIPQLLEKWKEGFHVVHAVRSTYGHAAGPIKRVTSKCFYKVMNAVSSVSIQPDSSEFRLLDRVVVDILKNMPERTPFFRALISWLGMKQTSISYQVHERYAGKSHFTYSRLFALALDGMISFSTRPLRWIMYLGFIVTFSVLPYGLWALFQFLVWGPVTPGWTSLVLINMLMGGCTLISLGIIGEYIGRIYTEVKSRPMFTIQETHGLENVQVSAQRTLGHSWRSFHVSHLEHTKSAEEKENVVPEPVLQDTLTEVTHDVIPWAG